MNSMFLMISLGAFLGLLSATVSESFFHRVCGHPNAAQLKLYFRFPKFFAPFLRAYYHHTVIHHHKTFRQDILTQFRDENEKATLDAWIFKEYPESFANLVMSERYNLTLKGIEGTLPFAMPFTLLPLLILLLFGKTVFIASLTTAFLPVLMSKFIHPLIHQPQGLRDAPWIVRKLARTRYMREIFKNHHMHHRHMKKNFNLLLGGDRILGVHQDTSAKDEAEIDVLWRRFWHLADNPELRTRINIPSVPPNALPLFTDGGGPCAEDAKYQSLIRPSLEERFLYRQARARALAMAKAAETSQVGPAPAILQDLAEAENDFGMSLDGAPIHFRNWRHRAEFAVENYTLQGPQVFYRGVSFRTGDVLLCNRSRNSDGIFTTLVEGRQQFSHVAMFALLEHAGKKFPSVIEIHHEGVRAVPLNAFLSREFSAYVEIFRSSQVSIDILARIAKEALTMTQEIHGFDIYIDESQDGYLTCARVVQQIYLRAGLPLIRGTSRYSLKTLKNLEILGVDGCAHRDLLMPDDYARHPDFSIVGAVDNGAFLEVTARNLMRERLQEIWQTQQLQRGRFPAAYSFLKFAVETAQKNTGLLGALVIRAFGFSPESFPSGPSTFIALTPIAERHMESGVRTLIRRLHEQPGTVLNSVSWDVFVRSQEMRTLVASASAKFAALYSTPDSDPKTCPPARFSVPSF